jgi:hypothetical protein
MDLDHVAGMPGGWVNRDWQPGNPGAFALVVGVSRYDFLKGQSTLRSRTAFVSALTSFRIFEWLRDSYYHRSCPLAKCWLLLAPTADELSTAPAMRGTSAAATFGGIKLAIQEWTQVMKDQREAAGASRGFFFFSGHGIEIRSDFQVLLPSDYERAVAGAPVVKPRHKTFYGTMELYVREPGGNTVGFSQHAKN